MKTLGLETMFISFPQSGQNSPKKCSLWPQYLQYFIVSDLRFFNAPPHWLQNNESKGI